ncbi:class II aldolase/adducin family protein (plasmid) [Gemmatirosa kalamazoonensis]|uniref:L-ribulose-5-phosphate 4-epimerase n=1 Tax=Gemmatirosa kalamazoonensis TaxID=861299 RepID=W0RQ04_9BACT|nr:L-ribulose-5-phosphate 4-epimerase AraD [Gemmatirosa kalamazoonensis]AHG92420.1 class II aldolase/adducin family protein [Gemmatirosa kalamazoonensis]
MSHDALREQVCQANLDLVKAGLVILTWGNVSGVDRDAGVMAIKPSGVAYDALRPEDIVVVSLDTGDVVEGSLRPSSDTPTHLVLYREFPRIGGVAHTHSAAAVSWAQAERDVPCFGTTHADHFRGCVPVTRRMRADEIRGAYEHNTGLLIAESFRERGLDPSDVPGVLVAGHGPFAWGHDVPNAVENAVALEATARMALDTLRINPDARAIDDTLLERHHRRKHGAEAYYGQGKA